MPSDGATQSRYGTATAGEGFRSWRDWWAAAAYGDGGYWLTAQPSDHFRTASASTDVLAQLIVTEMASRPEIRTVVELGAGEGALLTALHVLRPELRLYGVDLRNPIVVMQGITWCRGLWDVVGSTWVGAGVNELLATVEGPTLVVAAEWLDDLPCDIAVRTGRRHLVEVEVDEPGAERLGRRLGAAESRWAQRWWPQGDRVEVGLSRDRAWTDVITRLQRTGGMALAIDYGHRRTDRPENGTLTAYAHGRQLPAVPDRCRNLTAHVAIDALRAAGEQAGADTVRLCRLQDLVSELTPVDQPDALAALVQRSQRAALGPGGIWGGQFWLLQEVTRRTSS